MVKIQIIALMNNTYIGTKHDIDTKFNDNPHKLAIKHEINMIKTQVDKYAKTLDFFNL
jgi:hypothetical protein